jgi:hypothetical protein
MHALRAAATVGPVAPAYAPSVVPKTTPCGATEFQIDTVAAFGNVFFTWM